jgi:hypothetical protein
MYAELSISLELFFIEELVEGGLVRKIGMNNVIALDQFRLVTCQ